MSMPEGSLESVEAQLRKHADRGVFRSMSIKRVRGKLHCTFAWLTEKPMRLIYDPVEGVLEFRDLLPNAPVKSDLYEDFKQFLKQRTSNALPIHRRIDPSRVQVRRRNRSGSISLSLQSLDRDVDYAVSKALKLANEVFLGFLKGPYYEYMVDNFDSPEE